MKIAFDMDDVLFPFGEGLYKWYNEAYGTNIKFEDHTTYNLGIIFNCSYEEALKIIAKYCETEIFRNTEPKKGAQELIKVLKEKGHELIIITSRAKVHGDVNLEKETHKFFENFFKGQFSKIFITGQMTGGKITKRMICDEENVDLFVEDNLDYVKECAALGRKVLLFDRPWNQCDNLPAGVVRIYSMSEIVNYVNLNIFVD